MTTIPSFTFQSRLSGPTSPRLSQETLAAPPEAGRIIPERILPVTEPKVAQESNQPNHSFLLPSNIPAGATVVLQSFTPSTLESVMQLTQGRGGRFTAQGVLARYEPSGQEPACIVIRGQSGRPCLAHSGERFDEVAGQFWQPFRQQLQQLRNKRRELSLCQDLWPIVAQATADLLSARTQPVSTGQVEHWFRGWSRYRMTRVATARALLQSAAVATGVRPVDIPAALGEVWRQLQSGLQPLLHSGHWTASSAPRLQHFTREMERIANGPTAETVCKLLGLMRCRLVVTTSEGDTMAEALRWAEQGSHARALKLKRSVEV